MGHWQQLEPTPSHISYLSLSLFLIVYALFERFIRNRLHLSEPPIALVYGIILGPQVLAWITPNFCGLNGCHDDISIPGDQEVGGWGWGDDVVQEATRVIVCIQVFAVGVELPKYYMGKHWKSLGMLLGPVMAAGWLICAALVMLIFRTSFVIGLVVAACLTPTDPVLAASILSNSQFSDRVPKRVKQLLSAETGCNDGTSFPFLYIGLFLLTKSSGPEAVKNWFLITILWQCVFGIAIGLVLGVCFNRILRFSEKRGYIAESGFLTFYLLLAVLSVGLGSILGTDDFLVSFGCGYGFARDGWFSDNTKQTKLPQIIDLMLNSAMFIYLGSIIPWQHFEPEKIQPFVTIPRLLGFVALVFLLRRIPIMMATYRFIPHIKTWREALFCGHFGPMGLGALFLAIEARAVLETGSAEPLPKPEIGRPPYTPRQEAVAIVWPIVCFTVMSSTLVHGLSVLVLSVTSHLTRAKDRRAAFPAGETEPLMGMDFDDEHSSYGAADHEDDVETDHS